MLKYVLLKTIKNNKRQTGKYVYVPCFTQINIGKTNHVTNRVFHKEEIIGNAKLATMAILPILRVCENLERTDLKGLSPVKL